jgi:drug/metabolite transporter (DMT)-like permease
LLFAVAAQTLPIMNLVTIVYLSRASAGLDWGSRQSEQPTYSPNSPSPAAIVFNILSAAFFSSHFSFRSKIVSVSISLGLALLIQPTFLFPDNEDYDTVPASPIDLPPIGNYDLQVPVSLAYAAAFASTFFMVLSLGLLGRAVKVSIYHSISSNSIVTAILSIIVLVASSSSSSPSRDDPLFIMPSRKQGVLSLAIVTTSFFAHVFQTLAFQRKAPRQISLITFIQPVLSTGLQMIFLDHTIDVLPLLGSVLIAINM